MKKTVLKASYRTEDEIYSDGYICIKEDCTEAFFTFDYAIVEIENEIIRFYLTILDVFEGEYFNTLQFVGKTKATDTLECPEKYLLIEPESKNTLELNIIRKVTDPSTIKMVEEKIEKYKRDILKG